MRQYPREAQRSKRNIPREDRVCLAWEKISASSMETFSENRVGRKAFSTGNPGAVSNIYLTQLVKADRLMGRKLHPCWLGGMAWATSCRATGVGSRGRGRLWPSYSGYMTWRAYNGGRAVAFMHCLCGFLGKSGWPSEDPACWTWWTSGVIQLGSS